MQTQCKFNKILKMFENGKQVKLFHSGNLYDYHCGAGDNDGRERHLGPVRPGQVCLLASGYAGHDGLLLLGASGRKSGSERMVCRCSAQNEIQAAKTFSNNNQGGSQPGRPFYLQTV